MAEFELLLTKAATALVLPPGSNLVLCLLAWVLWRRARAFAAATLVFALASLYVMSMPVVARWSVARLETVPALSDSALRAASPQAIVVLSAGRFYEAPEFGGRDVVGRNSLLRLRYAAHLQRRTRLPILVSGGRVFSDGESLAMLMKTSLEQDFNARVRWLEERSRNTAENASYSAEILRGAGVSRVVLVTQAAHMPRSVAAFEQTGLAVVPAPTGFSSIHSGDDDIIAWLPSAHALSSVSHVLHEYIGRFWYRLRYR